MEHVEGRATSEMRPRAASWGRPPDRQALQQIAEDVAARARFRVCAIEVLRADGMLETVAVAGHPHLVDWAMGEGTPATAKDAAFAAGATFGSLTFVASEWLGEEALGLVDTYGYVPVLPDSAESAESGDRADGADRADRADRADGADGGSAWSDPWRPHDMLVARLTDGSGELRAVLHLDEPVSGRRPSAAQLAELDASLQLAFRAVVTTVERESLALQVRMAQAARSMIRAASGRLEIDDLLELATRELRDAFRASYLEVYVDQRDEPVTPQSRGASQELLDELARAMRRAWVHERVVLVEPGHVWGDPVLDAEFGDELDAVMDARGLSVLVLVPMGSAGQLFGTLVIHRDAGEARWTDSESAAALEVGRDLAGALLQARALQGEHQLNTELRHLDDYRQELISTVSHELKNPIGAILGHLEMLEAEDGLPRHVSAGIEAVGRAATRLGALAEDLLTLSRLGAGGAARAALPIDLSAVLTEAVDGAQVAAGQAQVRVEVLRSDAQAVVLGDADDLYRVFANLISNAIKYSDPGDTVQLCLEVQEEGACFTCTDEGMGIAEEDRVHLFDEFFRSTNPRALARPGTGLGLPIVKRVVERHGGRITVESEPGEGTRMQVWLPLSG